MRAIEFRVFKWWFHIGLTFRRLAIGISIDRYGFNLDVGPIWISIEF